MKNYVLCGVNMMFADDPSFRAGEPMWAELHVAVVHAGKRIAGNVLPLPAADPLVRVVLSNRSRQPESAEDVPVLWLSALCPRSDVERTHGDFVLRVQKEAAQTTADQEIR